VSEKKVKPFQNYRDKRSLSDILNGIDEHEGKDFEGDRTYRVHVQVAKELIREAYNINPQP
jgi:hypothetical protein